MFGMDFSLKASWKTFVFEQNKPYKTHIRQAFQHVDFDKSSLVVSTSCVSMQDL